jgi:hypothetical protein
MADLAFQFGTFFETEWSEPLFFERLRYEGGEDLSLLLLLLLLLPLFQFANCICVMSLVSCFLFLKFTNAFIEFAFTLLGTCRCLLGTWTRRRARSGRLISIAKLQQGMVSLMLS